MRRRTKVIVREYSAQGSVKSRVIYLRIQVPTLNCRLGAQPLRRALCRRVRPTTNFSRRRLRRTQHFRTPPTGRPTFFLIGRPGIVERPDYVLYFFWAGRAIFIIKT